MSDAQHYYPIKITTTWNAIPNEVVTSRTVNSFKNSLDKHWAENPPNVRVNGSNHRCRAQFKCAQTVIGQRSSGNGPNGLYYDYYYYNNYYYYTQSSYIHPYAHIFDTSCDLIFSICALFTVYPNSIMERHPTLLQVITTRGREGCPKEHRAMQKLPRKTHSVTYAPGLSTISYLSRIVEHPPPSFLFCPIKATFTPSIQPDLGLPRTRPPFTSAIYTLLAIRYSSILSTCPNHLNTL